LTSYISDRNASPATLVRHPRAVAAAEWRLRRIARGRPERLLLHREASPLSRGALERKLLKASTFGVYDFDDALQWDHGEGALFRRFAPKAPKAQLAVGLADRVIAGNPVLADWASDFNDDVVVIPSCVAPDLYSLKSDYRVGEPPRLVWIGSADNEAYFAVVETALREVHVRTGARLTLISQTTPTLGELESMIDRLSWSEQIQHERLASFDVGIAPLPDEPYTRGKSGYKLLQYAAAGLPLVGSPIGVNQRLLKELRMPAATSVEEWVDAIVDLLARPTTERERLGRHARRVVEAQYSYDAWLSRWQEAVVGGSPERHD
jgi:glycosyltransferase involved in cell wall biosynthesis